MDPNDLIETITKNVQAQPDTPDDEVWESVATEYQRLTGSELERLNPYHIAIAAAAYRTIRGRQ